MATEQKTQSRTGELDRVMQEAMERHRVPGAVVGIADGDSDEIACFGVTNLDNPLPVDEGTLFQIGSTTKTVTGTMVMRLVEEGKIDLDAPARAYLPSFRVADEEAAAGVTVRHLLTHTAGWEGDFFTDPAKGRGDDALEQIVEQMVDRPQLTPIGEIWAYNNAAFYVAGRIIELVTGKTYEEAARELVLDPLGMTHSFYFPEEVMTYRFAVGHSIQGDELQVARPWQLPRSAHAAGGIISTAGDQLRYARFHMGDGTAEDGTRLLSPESMALMQTPYASADNGTFIGLTWFIRDIDGVRVISHGGTTTGQLSEFQVAPSRKFGITVLTNGGYGHALGAEVVRWALKRYLDLDEPQPRPIEVSVEELEPLVGRFEGTNATIEFRIEDGGLMAEAVPKRGPLGSEEPPPAPPPVRVAILGEDRFIVLDPPFKDTQGEVLRGPDGDIAWIRFGKRIWARR